MFNCARSPRALAEPASAGRRSRMGCSIRHSASASPFVCLNTPCHPQTRPDTRVSADAHRALLSVRPKKAWSCKASVRTPRVPLQGRSRNIRCACGFPSPPAGSSRSCWRCFLQRPIVRWKPRWCAPRALAFPPAPPPGSRSCFSSPPPPHAAGPRRRHGRAQRISWRRMALTRRDAHERAGRFRPAPIAPVRNSWSAAGLLVLELPPSLRNPGPPGGPTPPRRSRQVPTAASADEFHEWEQTVFDGTGRGIKGWFAYPSSSATAGR